MSPGECNAGGADDVISFLPSVSTVVLNSRLPLIGGNLAILGGGVGVARTTIRRNPSYTCNLDQAADAQEFRILADSGSAEVSQLAFYRLNLERGCADGSATADRVGGAVSLSNDQVLIEDVRFIDNQASLDGGALYVGQGGLSMIEGEFVGNHATRRGGAAAMYPSGYSGIENTRFIQNSAQYGGAIGGGHFQMVESVLEQNTATLLGGALHITTDAIVAASTIKQNVAGNSGGGAHAENGDIHLIATTVSGNTANRGGGLSGNLWLEDSTVADNSAPLGSQLSSDFAHLTLYRSLIAGTGDASDCYSVGGSGFGPNNMATHANCGPGGVSLTVVSRGELSLGPLADNGGPNETHALGARSVAIDAGGLGCISVDQRGVARPFGSACDVGAFEYTEVAQTSNALTVSRAGDAGNGVCGVLVGECTLRDAVLAAHDIVGDVSISFDPAVFSSPVVSELTQGRIIVRRSLNIQGPGRDLLTLDAALNSRHFDIYDGQFETLSVVRLSGMRLINGRAMDANGGSIRAQESLHLDDVALIDNAASGLGLGGAVYAGGMPDGATVAFTDVAFENNASTQGGGAYIAIQNGGQATMDRAVFLNNQASDGSLARGGGVHADVSGSTLSLQDVRFESNAVDCTGFCGGGGAALHILDGSDVTVSSSSWIGNSVSAIESEVDAGGLWLQIDEGSVSLESCLFEGNSVTAGGGDAARGGGGVFEAPMVGSLSIDRCTFTDNASSDVGGGIYLNIPFDGEVTVSNSTLSGNTSNFDGGGVFALTSPQSVLAVVGSTIAQNRSDADSNGLGSGGGMANSSFSSGTISVDGSIVAGNVDNGSAPDIAVGTSLLELRDALLGDNAGSGQAEAPIGSPDMMNNLIGSSAGAGLIDPVLGDLTHINALTRVHNLQPGSPAIDRFSGCSGADQAGSPRGVDHDGMPGNDCDIGAVEFTVRLFRHGFE
ncbi:MAG: hypothetical protein KDJ14_11800 [Xanthomonadales bacterium]|nr:hypothetical protein [Xanthomonadales bacterium]